VTVILGLRPFTAAARILPEQAVGRGLRLMGGVSPDSTQTLEVMGTRAFENFVRELETEGVGIRTVTTPPPPPVKIEPVREKRERDIAIPMTKPSYERNYRNLNELTPTSLEPVYRREEVGGRSRITLRMEFATTETDVHEVELVPEVLPDSRELLGRITRSVVSKARLAGEFARLYPLVRAYCKKRAFSEDIDLDEEAVRDHLRQPGVQEKISNYLAQEIGKATVEVRPLKFERRELKLSDTKEFAWRRNLPLAACQKTIFNLVATYNDYEKRFALFLEGAPDVDRFAALGTTEQDSGSVFRVDYLKPSGAIGFYHPDFVVVQNIPEGEVNRIVETKGRVWEDTEAKDAAITHWCEEVSAADPTGGRWSYVRVNQILFDSRPFWESFSELARASVPVKEADGAGETLLDPTEEDPETEPSEGLPIETWDPETTEETEDEVQPPDPRAAAAALHACLSDGERVPSERLLEKAALRLGHRRLTQEMRRALGRALAAEQRARRLRFDPEQKLAWRPRKKNR
jgi:type III restriction enzyme